MQTIHARVDRCRGIAAGLTLVAVFVLILGSARDAGATSFLCTPVAVAAWSSRVHVRCSAAASGSISYFSVCNSPDSGFASRALSVFTTAKVTAKNLMIYYDAADTSGTACGCSGVDCRVITGAEVQQ